MVSLRSLDRHHSALRAPLLAGGGGLWAIWLVGLRYYLTRCMPVLKRSIAFLVMMAVAPSAPPLRGQPPLVLTPGEKLTYSVTWAVFDAGEVTATLQKTSAGPQDDYGVVTTARSHGFVSALYNLDDEFKSRFNPATLCSEGISKHVIEGRRRKQTDIVFDAARKLAILDERNLSRPSEPAKHDQQPIPACVEDVVSAFYFLRNQPLRVGDRITLPVNDGSKTTQVNVEVQVREQIDTPLGRRYALRVEPTVFSSLYKRKGRMLIWFSDDDQHLPLRIKAMISVGTLTGTLKSVTGTSPGVTASAPSGGSAAMGASRLASTPADESRKDLPTAKGPNLD